MVTVGAVGGSNSALGGHGIWTFHRIELVNPWIASLNRGLLVASLLTLSTLVHLWINKSDQLALEAAELEQQKNRLTASMQQLEKELIKFKDAAKTKRKPVLLTVKQYQVERCNKTCAPWGGPTITHIRVNGSLKTKAKSKRETSGKSAAAGFTG